MGIAFALPSVGSASIDAVSTSPFHDCMEAGGGFNDCRAAVQAQRELKREVTSSSTSPFHDCMEAENATWTACAKVAGLNTRSEESRSDLDARTLEARGLPFTFFPAIFQNGTTVGGGEKCYSVNNLGGTGWLTNTMVSKLAQEACTSAVNTAITASVGKFTAKKSGFYQGNGGPVRTPNVKFFLSVLLTSAQLAGYDIDVQDLGNRLCEKAIDHLISDTGCTAARKSGGKTEHTSVNGGEFDWGLFGAPPQYDNSGVCQNCLMTLIMEASNMVDIDGQTAIPIST